MLFGLAEIESEYRRERQVGGDRGGEGAGRLSRPTAGDDQGPTASSPGTPWPRSHGAGDRHSPERQPTDGLPIPGRGTDAVIMRALEPSQESGSDKAASKWAGSWEAIAPVFCSYEKSVVMERMLLQDDRKSLTNRPFRLIEP